MHCSPATHTMALFPLFIKTSHWFETHGDYHMDPFEGYHLKLPGDLCVVHDGAPLRVQAHVNDVRFASVHGNAGMGAASTVKLAPSSRWMQWNANPRKFSSLRLVVPSATGCHVPQCNSQLSVAQLSEARRSSRPYSWYLRIRMQLVVETLSSSRDAGDSSSSIENHLGHQQIHDVPSPTCERVDKFVMFYPRDYAAMHDALQVRLRPINPSPLSICVCLAPPTRALSLSLRVRVCVCVLCGLCSATTQAIRPM